MILDFSVPGIPKPEKTSRREENMGARREVTGDALLN